MSKELCRFLRPCFHSHVKPSVSLPYARFFSAATAACKEQELEQRKQQGKRHKSNASGDYEKRVAQLETYGSLQESYPRFVPSGAEYAHETNTVATLSGRVQSVRFAGSKLVFIDVERNGEIVQCMCNFGTLEQAGVTREDFRGFRHLVRRGDWYTVQGTHTRTSAGEDTLLASELPKLMAPSLHQLPRKLDDPETRARKPHVDMLVNHTLVRTLKTRSDIIRCLTDFLYRQGFNSVTTPLLGAGAGGAVARPFVTKATEFDGTELNLRIAPELWLKRLVVGGMGKVFEIGPAFRNEGVDNTHNPEFTICEFYSPFTTLPELMETTESLLRVVHEFLSARSKDRYPQLQETLVTPLMQEIGSSSPSYPKLEFVPTLEMLLEVSLPRLTDADASQRLLDLFAEKGLTVPSKPTLPRLLDALAAEYLEPLCQNPTFIINHPVALSPLAKSFTCPKTGQEVSARAELFINAREYANMYEEENSPFEQRKKFVDQLQYRAVDGEGDARERSGEIDESYLEALEWGLPPTGGWGIGIDRLVMLFSGQTRISDVLPFGTLRNIVGLASRPK